jgi:hypothetical protein
MQINDSDFSSTESKNPQMQEEAKLGEVQDVFSPFKHKEYPFLRSSPFNSSQKVYNSQNVYQINTFEGEGNEKQSDESVAGQDDSESLFEPTVSDKEQEHDKMDTPTQERLPRFEFRTKRSPLSSLFSSPCPQPQTDPNYKSHQSQSPQTHARKQPIQRTHNNSANEEYELRKRKNRESARKSRQKTKDTIATLRRRVAELETELAEKEQFIAQLQVGGY